MLADRVNFICCFFLFVSISTISCDFPSDFKRNNIHDGNGDSYIPTAPTSAKAVLIQNTVIVTWSDRSSYENGYIIERAFDDSNFVKIAELPENSNEFKDSYQNKLLTIYKITPFQKSTGNLKNNSVFASLDFYPQNLNVEIFDEEVLKISWENISPLTKNLLIERQIENGPFMRVTDVEVNFSSIFDTTTTFGIFTYRVQAIGENSKSGFAYAEFEVNHLAPGPPMNIKKQFANIAIPLHDGRIYVIDNSSTGEFYNPFTKTWQVSRKTYSGARAGIVLQDGKLLLYGLRRNQQRDLVPFGEVFDPATDSWSTLGPIDLEGDNNHYYLNLLRDGRGLLISSDGRRSICAFYVPEKQMFIRTNGFLFPRDNFALTVLPDDNVLIMGGIIGSNVFDNCEIYNPETETWTEVAPMLAKRRSFRSILLNNGKVLVIGGLDESGPIFGCEIYDPIANSWNPAAPTFDRSLGLVQKMADGTILLITPGLPYETKVYDPEKDTWTVTCTFSEDRILPGALALLPNGRVLLIAALSIQTEIYRP